MRPDAKEHFDFRRTRLAALFHDVGKPKTRSFADGGVSFHHHEVVGARMTEERMRALKYPNDLVDDVLLTQVADDGEGGASGGGDLGDDRVG